MKIIYQIAEENSIKALEARIEKALTQEWKLQGGVSSYSYPNGTIMYLQSMTRKIT